MRGTDTFKLVSIGDDAIDRDNCDLSKYAASRDMADLVLLDGAQPAVYHCRTLTLGERREVRNKASESDQYEAAFARGLERADSVCQRDGSRRDWRREQDRNGKSRIVSDADLEDVFVHPIVQEVGRLIWEKSFLPFRQGSEVVYRLPDISVRALLAIKRRPVAAPPPPADDKPQPAAPLQETSAT